MAQQGRTVLFVSHNMAAIRALCTRVMYLEQGKLGYIGEPQHAIRCYHNSVTTNEPVFGGSDISFTGVRINGAAFSTIAPGEPFEVSCDLHLRSGLPAFYLCCTVQDGGGEQMAVVLVDQTRFRNYTRPGSHSVSVRFPGLWLRTGVYNVYFKLVASAVGSGTKFLSDTVMLDVLGEHTPLVSLLNPQVEWSVRS